MSPNEEWNVCQWKHILKGQFVSCDKLQIWNLGLFIMTSYWMSFNVWSRSSHVTHAFIFCIHKHFTHTHTPAPCKRDVIYGFCEQATECVTDLDKLALVQRGYGGSVLGSSQFFATAPVASLQKWLKIYLKIITSIRQSQSWTNSVGVWFWVVNKNVRSHIWKCFTPILSMSRTLLYSVRGLP